MPRSRKNRNRENPYRKSYTNEDNREREQSEEATTNKNEFAGGDNKQLKRKREDQESDEGGHLPKQRKWHAKMTMIAPTGGDMLTPEQPQFGFSSIGGYEAQCLEVCRLCLHLKQPAVYEKLGIVQPRGLLLHGPPGCGKTMFARAIAGQLQLPIFCVSSTELVSGVSGGSEEKIRTLFARALEAAPSLVLLDDIDVIGAKREHAQREMEKRIVAQLIASLDELERHSSSTTAHVDDDITITMEIDGDTGNLQNGKQQDRKRKRGHVLVIGTTNRPEVLDASLRRAGRFDNEIALGIPDERSRARILEIATKNLTMAADVTTAKLSKLTPGYVGADLFSLVREASLCAVNRIFDSMLLKDKAQNVKDEKQQMAKRATKIEKIQDELDKMLFWLSSSSEPSSSSIFADSPGASSLQSLIDGLDDLHVELADFQRALTIVRPSAKREGFATVPDVTWDQIGALADVRQELQWSILNPIQRAEEFEQFGLSARPQGVLLCGPPGCGKTLLAKAVASETGMSFISVKGPELLSMYVGESERAVRTVFQRARDSAPCVIFFDELDALCPKRSQKETTGSARLVNQLLTEMDGLEARKQVFLIAATNRPDIVDPAILRPGRIDKVLFVDFPTRADRADILRKATANGTRPRIGAFDTLLEQLETDGALDGFTGADLIALVHDASVLALREHLERQQQNDGGGDHRFDVMMVEEDGNNNSVCAKHFRQALQRLRPSVAAVDRAHYARMRAQYKGGGVQHLATKSVEINGEVGDDEKLEEEK